MITNVGPVHLELLGLDRGDRRREGRAGRATCAPARRPSSPPTSRCSSEHLRDDITVVRLRRRAAPGRPRAAVHERPHAAQRLRRGRRRAGARRRAARARSTVELSAMRGQRHRAARAHRRRQRLLQRQPDVDARRPRRSCRVRGRPPRRRARRHARARPRRAALPRRDRRPCPRSRRRRCSSRSARWRARCTATARSTTAAEAAALVRELVRPGDTSWSRRRAASASRSSPRRSRKPRHGMGESSSPARPRCSSASSCRRSSSSSCATASSARTSARRAPRAITPRPGTPTMGGIIIFTAIAIPFLILSSYDWRSVGVFGAAIACALLGLRRRLHEDHPAPFAGPARAHEAAGHGRDLARAVVGRHQARRASRAT